MRINDDDDFIMHTVVKQRAQMPEMNLELYSVVNSVASVLDSDAEGHGFISQP